MSLGQFCLVAVLLVVVGGTQLLSWRSYRGLSDATSSFTLAQNVTGDFADAQRDALETALAIEKLSRGEITVSEAQMPNAFLGQQLRNLLPQELGTARPQVERAFEAQQHLSKELAAIQAAPRASVLAMVPDMRADADAMQANLRGLYARFEVSFYDRLRASLASRTSHQRWIVLGAVVSALIGLGLAWSLRRTVRRDFERAYELLLEESDEREAAQDEALRTAREIEYLAFHDRLTGLPNRLALERELDRLAALGAEGAVVSIDLDRLGAVNRTFGSETGDRLLRLTGEALVRSGAGTAAGGFVAHLGGDEFAVAYASVDTAEQAEGLARVLVGALESPAILDGHRVSVTGSAGVAIGTFVDGHGHELLRHADAALHQAKIEGRAVVAVFDDQRHREAQERSAVVSRLSRAESEGELMLHYQPLVDADGGSATGLEGLLRWNRDGTLVPPGEFIPVAEESGLIVPMGAWVIDRVCRDLRTVRNTSSGRGLYGSVNLAASQLRDPNLIAHIAGCLARYGLPAGSLVVELTESAIVDDPAQAESVLAALRDMGVRVAIDDFGTGYSSLGYLKQIPADILKIDRSLIADITVDERSVRLLEGIVSLAHDLGMRVTVEGVETEEQLALVRAAGCDTIQGFLVSRPQPMDDVHGVLRSLPSRPARPGVAASLAS